MSRGIRTQQREQQCHRLGMGLEPEELHEQLQQLTLDHGHKPGSNAAFSVHRSVHPAPGDTLPPRPGQGLAMIPYNTATLSAGAEPIVTSGLDASSLSENLEMRIQNSEVGVPSPPGAVLHPPVVGEVGVFRELNPCSHIIPYH